MGGCGYLLYKHNDILYEGLKHSQILESMERFWNQSLMNTEGLLYSIIGSRFKEILQKLK